MKLRGSLRSKDIRPLWDQFNARKSEIKYARPGVAYAIEENRARATGE